MTYPDASRIRSPFPRARLAGGGDAVPQADLDELEHNVRSCLQGKGPAGQRLGVERHRRT